MTIIDIKTKVPIHNVDTYSKQKEYEIQYEKIRKSISQNIETEFHIKYTNKKAIRLAICLSSLAIYSFLSIYFPSNFIHIIEIFFIMAVQIAM